MSKEFVKVEDVKEGDTLIADGGFECLNEGAKVMVLKDDNGNLCVQCGEGYHNLTGQLGGPFGGFEQGTHYVGFWKE